MKIYAENITKTYGDREVIKGISLEIPEGKTIGLLGPNGSGKSTTIKMLTGQILPTTGEVRYDDRSVKNMGKDINKKIGIMPQDVVAWDHLTLKENLDFMATLHNLENDFATERVKTLVARLQLERELSTQAENLSGGYRRRLNLAMSIIHDPEFIFLDEPTPGVDPQSRRALWDFIHELQASKKYSILLTDHYLDEAEKVCDYIVIIDYGSILAEGTLLDLKKKYAPGRSLQVDLSDGVDFAEAKFESLRKSVKKLFPEAIFLGNSVKTIAERPEKNIEEILNLMKSNNIAISDILLKESSLEDIFLLLTGRSIRHE